MITCTSRCDTRIHTYPHTHTHIHTHPLPPHTHIQQRRRSNVVCKTMHVPPPQLHWDSPTLQSPVPPPSASPSTTDEWTLTNLTQETAYPHTPNRLSFRLRPANSIAAGTPMGNTLQHNTTHCDTLQHTLQHTVTHVYGFATHCRCRPYW